MIPFRVAHLTIEMLRDEFLDMVPCVSTGPSVISELDDSVMLKAFDRTAMEYNGMTPLVDEVRGNALPKELCFLQCAVCHLCLQLRRRLISDDVAFSAGGVTSDMASRLINNLTKEVMQLQPQYQATMRARKIDRNVRLAYGRIG